MAVSKSDSYVTVKNGLFYLEGKRYTFMGANYWQGMNLGTSCCCGDRKGFCASSTS
jgi:mannan endo-1,4-beta-mannosidase